MMATLLLVGCPPKSQLRQSNRVDLPTPLAIASISKMFSEANAPTKIHLQDGIAATAEIYY
jgi:hypothetical protein